MMPVKFSIVGLLPDEERALDVPLPMVNMDVPREGEAVMLPTRDRQQDEMLTVRSVTWYPLGSIEDGGAVRHPPFVYVVLGKVRIGR